MTVRTTSSSFKPVGLVIDLVVSALAWTHAGEDGTPHESTSDLLVRVRQVMSICETQVRLRRASTSGLEGCSVVQCRGMTRHSLERGCGWEGAVHAEAGPRQLDLN